MNKYQERNVVLSCMGFDSYQDYLASEMWAGIRADILRQHPWCWKCDERASQVHHRRYDLTTLVGADMCGLVSVCQRCHYEAEFRDGMKRSLRQTNDALNCGEFIECAQCGIKMHSENFVRHGVLLSSCKQCMDDIDDACRWMDERRAEKELQEAAACPNS